MSWYTRMFVSEAIGYESVPGALIVLRPWAPRFWAPPKSAFAAADVESRVGATNSPSEFWTSAVLKSFCSA